MKTKRLVVLVCAAAGWWFAPVARAQDATINDAVGPDAVADCEAAAWAVTDVATGDFLPTDSRRALYSCVGEVDRLMGTGDCPDSSEIDTPGKAIVFFHEKTCSLYAPDCHCTIRAIHICDPEGTMTGCREVDPGGRVLN